jgi:hypothetical protein
LYGRNIAGIGTFLGQGNPVPQISLLFYSKDSSVVGIVRFVGSVVSFGLLWLFLLLLLFMETKLFDMPSEINFSNPEDESLKSKSPVINFVIILA